MSFECVQTIEQGQVANTYLALPKRLIRDKNEVILNPILALATSDGMKTDIAPKMLRKRLGT